MKTVTAPPIDKQEARRGFSIFSGYCPSIDRWLARRAAVKGLEAETERLDKLASGWEERGHWQMAGRCREAAAKMAERSIDISFDLATAKRREALLRAAIVDYAVEVGEAARFDPAVIYRMYIVARRLGEAALAKKKLGEAMKGFDSMYADRNLEALVRLNRLKREFLFQLWEGEASDAIRIAAEAAAVAREIRAAGHTCDRSEDTERWIEEKMAERYRKEAA